MQESRLYHRAVTTFLLAAFLPILLMVTPSNAQEFTITFGVNHNDSSLLNEHGAFNTPLPTAIHVTVKPGYFNKNETELINVPKEDIYTNCTTDEVGTISNSENQKGWFQVGHFANNQGTIILNVHGVTIPGSINFKTRMTYYFAVRYTVASSKNRRSLCQRGDKFKIYILPDTSSSITMVVVTPSPSQTLVSQGGDRLIEPSSDSPFISVNFISETENSLTVSASPHFPLPGSADRSTLVISSAAGFTGLFIVVTAVVVIATWCKILRAGCDAIQSVFHRISF